MPLNLLQPGNERLRRGFGVTEEHSRFVLVEKEILNAGKARGHRVFHDDNGLAMVGFDDEHSADRVLLSSRVAGLTTSLAPITRHTFMWPGMRRRRDGWQNGLPRRVCRALRRGRW